jgi:hypothetical protein
LKLKKINLILFETKNTFEKHLKPEVITYIHEKKTENDEFFNSNLNSFYYYYIKWMNYISMYQRSTRMRNILKEQ